MTKFPAALLLALAGSAAARLFERSPQSSKEAHAPTTYSPKSRNGDEACEGHGYDQDQCDAVGCCQWVDGECWSAVGTDSFGSCEDDMDWHLAHGRNINCATVAEWVDSGSCEWAWQSLDGTPAREACKKTCGTCPDPAPAPPCEDDMDWHLVHGRNINCATVAQWVDSGSCEWAWQSLDGTPASEACKKTCGTCGTTRQLATP